MAKIQSHVSSEIHGSVGGLTFQGSSIGGTILRSKPIPIHPKSHAQCINQSRFSGVISMFNSIDPTNYEMLQSVFPDGNSISSYIRLVFPLINRLRSAGSSYSIDTITPVSAELAPSILRTIPPSPGNIGFRLQLDFSGPDVVYPTIWLSPPQSLSKKRYYNQFDHSSYYSYYHGVGPVRTSNFYGLLPDRSYFLKIRGISFIEQSSPSIRLIRVGKPYFIRAVSLTA